MIRKIGLACLVSASLVLGVPPPSAAHADESPGQSELYDADLDKATHRFQKRHHLPSGKTKTIHFEEPVRVSLYYWTFDVAKDGSSEFLTDVYQRDRRVLRALDGPFKHRKAHRRAGE